MGKGVIKLPFFKTNNTEASAKSLWPWPSCHQQPRTLSFRITTNPTTTNSNESTTESSSNFTNSSDSTSLSTDSTVSTPIPSAPESIERVIKGLIKSERLFFKPGEYQTSSILEQTKNTSQTFYDYRPFKQNDVVLSMDSRDPYVDFRESMEEMVGFHGLDNWVDFEELLCWYLKANEKSSHGYIIGAFVDLLIEIAFANNNKEGRISCSIENSPARLSPASALSFYSSSESELTSSPLTCSTLKESAATEIQEEGEDNIASC